MTCLEANVKALFNFFHYSAVRSNKLREVQLMMEEPQVRLTEWHSVRWLSLQKAMGTIFKTYGPLVCTMEHEAADNPTAKGIYTFIKEPKFALTAALLLDVLRIIEPLNRQFQAANANLASLQPLVLSALKALETLQEKPGSTEALLRNNIRDHGNHQGVPLLITTVLESEFSNLRVQYLSKVSGNLERRFPQEATDLLSQFRVLSPLSWPEDNSEAYGQKEVKTLVAHFTTFFMNCEGEDVTSEWEQFFNLVRDNHRPALGSFEALAQLVHSDLAIPFPTVAALYALYQVLSVSSADCERGFSAQNNIKSQFRSCLKSSTLQHLQLIRTEGPSLEHFNFASAIGKWRQLKERRM